MDDNKHSLAILTERHQVTYKTYRALRLRKPGGGRPLSRLIKCEAGPFTLPPVGLADREIV